MTSVILVSILAHLTTHTTYGVILRESCLQYADFSYQKQNAALQGSVIATFTNKSPKECEDECINKYPCKSINTETAGSKTCELNSATEVDSIDNVTVTTKTGWTFKSTNYTELLIGEYCKAFKPCGPTEMCTDSCYCPGYTCYPCKTMELGISCLAKVAISDKPLGVFNSSVVKSHMMSSSSDYHESRRAWFGRLDGNAVWCAKHQDKAQYLQIIFRGRKIITGIAVQTHPSSSKWVKKYQLQYTSDRYTWKMYTENGLVKTFLGPADDNEAKRQNLPYYIQAYTVVFRPTEWHNLICMRVELYGQGDFLQPANAKVNPLGFKSGEVLDNQFSSSQIFSAHYPASKARLNHPGEWLALRQDKNQFLKIVFPTRKIITHITMQKSSQNNWWVKTYQISFSEDQWQFMVENSAYNLWQDYKEHSVIREFYGPANTVGKRKQMLAHPIRAFGIKIKPTTFHGYIAIRMELYGYDDPVQPSVPAGCTYLDLPLGMEFSYIPNDKITASSSYDSMNLPYYGRFNGPSQWCDRMDSNKPTEYLQVDLGNNLIITGVATQGHGYGNYFVKTFRVKYAEAAPDPTFQFYPSNATPKIFKGNTHHAQAVKNRFDPPFTAQFVQVNPVTFEGLDICLRIELYGCHPTVPVG